MKGNLRLKKLPCSSHHKKYLIGQHKSVSISGASWRARMRDIGRDLQSWSCLLAPQPDGRHLIIHPRRCIILVLREDSPPPLLYTAALSYEWVCWIIFHLQTRLTVIWLEQSTNQHLHDSVKCGGKTAHYIILTWHADIPSETVL